MSPTTGFKLCVSLNRHELPVSVGQKRNHIQTKKKRKHDNKQKNVRAWGKATGSETSRASKPHPVSKRPITVRHVQVKLVHKLRFSLKSANIKYESDLNLNSAFILSHFLQTDTSDKLHLCVPGSGGGGSAFWEQCIYIRTVPFTKTCNTSASCWTCCLHSGKIRLVERCLSLDFVFRSEAKGHQKGAAAPERYARWLIKKHISPLKVPWSKALDPQLLRWRNTRRNVGVKHQASVQMFSPYCLEELQPKHTDVWESVNTSLTSRNLFLVKVHSQRSFVTSV